MTTLAPPQPIPIVVNDQGVWRVDGSRVTVDSIVYEYRRGSTPEQIQDDFPSLPLARIYEVISYYLNHTEEVDTYLTDQENQAQSAWDQWSSHPGVKTLSAKIRAARDERAKDGKG